MLALQMQLLHVPLPVAVLCHQLLATSKAELDLVTITNISKSIIYSLKFNSLTDVFTAVGVSWNYYLISHFCPLSCLNWHVMMQYVICLPTKYVPTSSTGEVFKWEQLQLCLGTHDVALDLGLSLWVDHMINLCSSSAYIQLHLCIHNGNSYVCIWIICIVICNSMCKNRLCHL